MAKSGVAWFIIKLIEEFTGSPVTDFVIPKPFTGSIII
jgi:hypothetical protein